MVTVLVKRILLRVEKEEDMLNLKTELEMMK